MRCCLEDRYQVGILDKPLAIPSEDEMNEEGYSYFPCPLSPRIPVPPNIFLHHLQSPKPHPRLTWYNRLPKKIDKSIHEINHSLVIGWGVHIIEGPDKFAIYVTVFFLIILGGVFGIFWSIRKRDVQGGFGMGAWVMSILCALLMVVLAKWSQE